MRAPSKPMQKLAQEESVISRLRLSLVPLAVLIAASARGARAQGFAPTGSMIFARTEHTATLLNNGLVLVTGGESTGRSILNTAELYNPQTRTWRLTRSPMNVARVAHTATLLPDGRV